MYTFRNGCVAATAEAAAIAAVVTASWALAAFVGTAGCCTTLAGTVFFTAPCKGLS